MGVQRLMGQQDHVFQFETGHKVGQMQAVAAIVVILSAATGQPTLARMNADLVRLVCKNARLHATC